MLVLVLVLENILCLFEYEYEHEHEYDFLGPHVTYREIRERTSLNSDASTP